MGSSSIHSEKKDPDYAPKVATTKEAIGDEAFQQAMIKEPPPKIAVPLLIVASFVAFCCSTANGFDGSLLGVLLSNKNFKNYFGVGNAGIEAGIVTSMYQIGSVVAIPFVGPAIDTWGRRVSHPAHRGVITGLYNVMWPVGAIVASGAARGGLNYGGNTSWMIPVCLQLMFPAIIAFGSLWLPESPRWLYTRGKHEQARENLVKLHGRGNPDSEWVKLQLTEYEQFLEMDGTDKKWWDYRALFRDRASFYRLTCNCLVSLFGQWAGNNVVSYYLSAFLDTAGITEDIDQTNIALGMNAIQIAFATLGATFTDTIGRRPMLIVVNIVCGLCWIGVTVPASIGNITDLDDDAQKAAVSPSVSRAVLAWVYIFQICYSIGWTPLQALYPVEVLSYEIRAKGMAFSSLFTSAAMLVMQFGMPVALKNIAWKTYIVFCIWCFIQSGILYFLVPETKNRTLEELDHIFSSKNPVKTSKEKKVYQVDENANVVNIDVATSSLGASYARPSSSSTSQVCQTCFNWTLHFPPEKRKSYHRGLNFDFYDIAASAELEECRYCYAIYQCLMAFGAQFRLNASFIVTLTATANQPFHLSWDDGQNRRLTLEVYSEHGFNEFAVDRRGSTRAIQGDANEPHLLQQARRWLKNCQENHLACNQVDGPFPRRLIFVGNESAAYKLDEHVHPDTQYVALSHCWGTEQAFTTRRSNLDERRLGIKQADLPATFQDAITVTQGLGLEYIWIDSLCIVQDDESDWNHESGRMGGIYERSCLTIAASTAPSDQVGFLGASSQRLFHVSKDIDMFPFSEASDVKARMVHDIRQPTMLDPLLRRAWTFQESLTKESDWLPALSALARKFHENVPSDAYLAGIWREDALIGLCWEVNVNSERTQAFMPGARLPRRGYRAPTWSWASVEAPIQFFPILTSGERLIPRTSVLDAQCRGPLIRASLSISIADAPVATLVALEFEEGPITTRVWLDTPIQSQRIATEHSSDASFSDDNWEAIIRSDSPVQDQDILSQGTCLALYDAFGGEGLLARFFQILTPSRRKGAFERLGVLDMGIQGRSSWERRWFGEFPEQEILII
ncbi:hypothetical protein ACJZ2D_014328 [Fusarium nematophilum]